MSLFLKAHIPKWENAPYRKTNSNSSLITNLILPHKTGKIQNSLCLFYLFPNPFLCLAQPHFSLNELVIWKHATFRTCLLCCSHTGFTVCTRPFWPHCQSSSPNVHRQFLFTYSEVTNAWCHVAFLVEHMSSTLFCFFFLCSWLWDAI